MSRPGLAAHPKVAAWYEPGVPIADVGGTFSRADGVANATYFSRDGVLLTAAVGVLRDEHYAQDGRRYTISEPGTTNRLLRCNDFANAYWTKTNCSVSSNADTALDGTATADRIVENSSAGLHSVNSTTVTITANANITFSQWFKPGGRSWVYLKVYDSTNTDWAARYFDLATGALGSTGTVGTATHVQAYIERGFGTMAGWVRCVLAVNIGNGRTSIRCETFLATSNGGVSYTGDGASYVTTWGAQLEDGKSRATMLVVTDAAMATRAADNLTLPMPAALDAGSGENEFTVYSDILNLGHMGQPFFPRLWGFGSTGGASTVRALKGMVNTGNNRLTVNFAKSDDSAQVSSSPSGVVEAGDRHEFVAQVYSDATVQGHVSLNRNATVSGPRSAALSGGHAAWSANHIGLGGAASGAGVLTSAAGVLLGRFVVALGILSMAEMRGLSRFIVGQESAEFVHLLALSFESGTLRLCTAAQDIQWNGNTYEAIGGLLEIGGTEEASDGKAQGVDLKLAGVTQTIISTILSTNFRGQTVLLYLAHLDRTTGQVVDAPLLIHKGLQLSSYTIEESRDRNAGTVTVSTRVSGYLGATRVRGIQTNLVSHQHHFSGDTFFMNTASLSNVKVYWGTSSPNGTGARGGSGRFRGVDGEFR